MSATKPRKPFIVILGILIAVLVVGFGAYLVRMTQAVKNDPQTVAGVAHLAGQDTREEALASVTTGAKDLQPGETNEAVTNPGQPAYPGQRSYAVGDTPESLQRER